MTKVQIAITKNMDEVNSADRKYINNFIIKVNAMYINSFLSKKSIDYLMTIIEENDRDIIYDFLISLAVNLVKETDSDLVTILSKYLDIHNTFYDDVNMDDELSEILTSGISDPNKHAITLLSYILRLHKNVVIDAYLLSKAKHA